LNLNFLLCHQNMTFYENVNLDNFEKMVKDIQ